MAIDLNNLQSDEQFQQVYNELVDKWNKLRESKKKKIPKEKIAEIKQSVQEYKVLAKQHNSVARKLQRVLEKTADAYGTNSYELATKTGLKAGYVDQIRLD